MGNMDEMKSKKCKEFITPCQQGVCHHTKRFQLDYEPTSSILIHGVELQTKSNKTLMVVSDMVCQKNDEDNDYMQCPSSLSYGNCGS